MSDAEVLGEIRRVLKDELELGMDVAAHHELQKDLGLDSLTLMSLVVALEDRFRIALHAEDAEHIRTVGQLAACVARRAEGAA